MPSRTLPGLAGGDRRVPGPAAGRRGHPRDHPARGRHAAAARSGPVRPHRLRGVPQGRGGQPDRLVQGPRHDGGHQHGRRERRQGGDLRVDRQHQRERRRLRGPGRAHLRGARAARQDRHRQAGPGAGARGQAAAGRRLVRRLPRAGQEAGRRVPGGAGQLGQPGPAAGPEDRRVRDRGRARRRARRALPAGRQRREHHRLLDGLHRVPAGRAGGPGHRGCSASRPAARRRS